MSVRISAIVCTHNRADYLPRALQSLVNQNMPKDHYDIIVVDNHSTDDTKRAVERFSSTSNMRYIYEATVGLSYARNSGWHNARSPYVAYLDDDAIAHPEWLNRIVETFQTVTPQPGCVGGKTEPIWETDRPRWLSDWLLHGLAIIDWTDTPHVLDNLSAEWLVGANIAFPVDVLRQTAGFTSKLDRAGKNLLSSGDVFLEKQIKKMGYSCFYHPDISIKHHIFKSRLTQSWFRRRYFSQGLSDAIMQLIEKRPSRRRCLRIAISRARSLLQPPNRLMNLLLPTNDPDRFTEKCFALITVGHIVGMLDALRR